jgi:hypothetical protein
MFAIRMIQLIEAHAENLSDELICKLESCKRCPELLRKVPRQELRLRAHEIYRNLSDWLLSKTGSDVEERYMGLGVRRAKQGVPFSEILTSIAVSKECLWEYLEREDLLGDPVELLGDLNLLHALGRFFDRIAYSVAIGYESVHKDIGKTASDSRSNKAVPVHAEMGR